MKLRPYQVQAVDALVRGGHGSFINVAPGAGKSLIVAELAKRLGKCLVLVPSKELVEQNCEEMRAVHMDPSIYSASCGVKELGDITIATPLSIVKEDSLPFQVVIVDECDLVSVESVEKTYMKIIMKCPNVVLFGMSATCFRNVVRTSRSGRYIRSETWIRPINRIYTKGKGFLWKQCVFQYTAEEGIRDGYLSPIKLYSSTVNRHVLKPNSTGAEWTEESMERWGMLSEKRILDGIKYCQKNHKKTIVFLPDIATTERVASITGLPYVTSKTARKDREGIVEHFRHDGGVLLNPQVFQVGFNVKDIDAIILANPTKSLRRYVQIVGRGTRKAEGKEHCCVYDLAGVSDLFGDATKVRLVRGDRTEVVGDRVFSNKPISDIQFRVPIRQRPTETHVED